MRHIIGELHRLILFFMVEICNFFSVYQKCKNYLIPQVLLFFEVGNASTAGIDFFDFLNLSTFFLLYKCFVLAVCEAGDVATTT